MKTYLAPKSGGRIIVFPDQVKSAPSDLIALGLSPQQESEFLLGNTHWIPEMIQGQPTGNGTLSLPPVEVPRVIANWRAKAVIELHGLTEEVEAALAAMEGEAGITARAAWNGNADFARHGATVTALATTLSLNSAQLDAMFIQAAALEV